MAFVQAYPYLFGAILLLAICAGGFLACPKQRLPMFLSASLSAPWAITSVVFVPEYWNPVRVATFFRTGPEDFIFSFASGGVVWLIGIWFVRKRITLNIEAQRVANRAIFFASAFVVILLALSTLGLGVMTTTFAGLIVIELLLFSLRPKLWPIAVCSAMGFTLLYVVVANAVMWVCPHFLSQWSSVNLWGSMALGLPTEEVVWPFAYGAVWPLFMAYALDARIAAPSE